MNFVTCQGENFIFLRRKTDDRAVVQGSTENIYQLDSTVQCAVEKV